MVKYCVLFLMVSSVAFAEPSPSEQALGNKILVELQAGLTCNTNLIQVQIELAKTQARLKELEAKDKK